jgi:hypothetical protein
MWPKRVHTINPSSIFGMNLNSGIEEDPYAFYVTTFFITIFSGFIILFCVYRFGLGRNDITLQQFKAVHPKFRPSQCRHDHHKITDKVYAHTDPT